MAKKTSGIYKIENIINGKIYIGRSKNIEKRWFEHKRELKHNSHHSRKLQNAVNKYGIENFIFSIIEEAKESDIVRLEQEYLDLYNSVDDGYNIIKTASPLAPYRQVSSDTKAKLSAAAKGKIRSQETKLKLSRSKLGKKSNFTKLTKELVMQIREDYLSGEYTCISLGLKFDISPANICLIVNNKTWNSEKYENDLILKNANKVHHSNYVRLNFDIAEKIREEYAAGGITQLELAKKYNVIRNTIGSSIQNKAWKK
jgi:group I intron endonuclease